MKEMPMIPPVRTALHLLKTAGFEGYLVGGCVRDFLLGKTPTDYDMTTNATPDEMKRLFSAYRLLETGIRHGTVTVVLDGVPLELTTYRVDGGYMDARHPENVCFTRSLREDAARRDFTINAMAYHPDEGILDFFDGRGDLKRRQLRCVGDAQCRLQEDALRILRALRFAAVLDFSVEKRTEEAIFEHRGLISCVSAERIAVELQKLLCGCAVGRVLQNHLPALSVALPELQPLQNQALLLRQIAAALERTEPTLTQRVSLLLYGLEGIGVPPDGGALLHRLCLSRGQREEVRCLLLALHAPLTEEIANVRRWLGVLTPAVYRTSLHLRRAWSPEDTAQQERLEAVAGQLLEQEGCMTLQTLAVCGKDLLDLGLQGKLIGQSLQLLLEEVRAGHLPNTKTALLGWLGGEKNAKEKMT